MDFEIEEIKLFSGRMAHIYTIRPNNSDTTLFEDFYNENIDEFPDDLQEIKNVLYLAGHEKGCRSPYFKPNEGRPGDGVAALKVGNLRVYCLLIGKITVILGSGGYKAPEIQAYQEDEALNAKAKQMIRYAEQINRKIIEKDITIEIDGKLTINNWDD
ncbi:MAG: hypothetical protein K6F58_07865 [Bacteroidales bacterium]|nr:hypothetical protein [Bacteroidales bacterium]